MIDMVEARVMAGQIATHLVGKEITAAELGGGRKGRCGMRRQSEGLT